MPLQQIRQPSRVPVPVHYYSRMRLFKLLLQSVPPAKPLPYKRVQQPADHHHQQAVATSSRDSGSRIKPNGVPDHLRFAMEPDEGTSQRSTAHDMSHGGDKFHSVKHFKHQAIQRQQRQQAESLRSSTAAASEAAQPEAGRSVSHSSDRQVFRKKPLTKTSLEGVQSYLRTVLHTTANDATMPVLQSSEPVPIASTRRRSIHEADRRGSLGPVHGAAGRIIETAKPRQSPSLASAEAPTWLNEADEQLGEPEIELVIQHAASPVPQEPVKPAVNGQWFTSVLGTTKANLTYQPPHSSGAASGGWFGAKVAVPRLNLGPKQPEAPNAQIPASWTTPRTLHSESLESAESSSQDDPRKLLRTHIKTVATALVSPQPAADNAAAAGWFNNPRAQQAPVAAAAVVNQQSGAGWFNGEVPAAEVTRPVASSSDTGVSTEPAELADVLSEVLIPVHVGSFCMCNEIEVMTADTRVAVKVHQAIGWLDEHVHGCEGLWVRAGSKVAARRMAKESQEHGGFTLDENTDAHALAAVLLKLIWAIPGSLIEKSTSIDLQEALKMGCSPGKLLQILKTRLPEGKQAMLGWLLAHWKKVAVCSKQNTADLAAVAAWAVFLGASQQQVAVMERMLEASSEDVAALAPRTMTIPQTNAVASSRADGTVSADFEEMSPTEAILLANKVRQLFALLDHNSDGKLSVTEFEQACGKSNLALLLGKFPGIESILLSKFMGFFHKEVSYQIGPQLALQLVSTLCSKEATSCALCGAIETHNGSPPPKLDLCREAIRLFTIIDLDHDTVVTTQELSTAWGKAGKVHLDSLKKALSADGALSDCITLRDWSIFWAKFQDEQGYAQTDHQLELIKKQVERDHTPCTNSRCHHAKMLPAQFRKAMPAQLREFTSSIFNRLDASHNGVLEKQELFASQFASTDLDGLLDMWKVMDEDADGLISEREWLDHWEAQLQRAEEADVRERLSTIEQHASEARNGFGGCLSSTGKQRVGAAAAPANTDAAAAPANTDAAAVPANTKTLTLKQDEAEEQARVAARESSLHCSAQADLQIQIAKDRNKGSTRGVQLVKRDQKPRKQDQKPATTLADAFLSRSTAGRRKAGGPAGRYTKSRTPPKPAPSGVRVSIDLIERLSEKVFVQLDCDGSGSLVMSEVMNALSSDSEASDIMKAIDVSLDGSVSMSEWKAHWIAKGHQNAAITEMQIKRIRNKLKRSKQGEKKRVYTLRPPNPQVTKLATKVFKMLDTDCSGMLILSELLDAGSLLTAHGQQKQSWAAEMMREMDIEKDGDITQQEWRMYWASTDAGDDASVSMQLQRMKTKLAKVSRPQGPTQAHSQSKADALRFKAVHRLAERVFILLDQDGSGAVRLSEMLDALHGNDQQAMDIMKSIDGGLDQVLSLPEWLVHWQNQALQNLAFTELALRRLRTNLTSARSNANNSAVRMRPYNADHHKLQASVFSMLDTNGSGILILLEMMNSKLMESSDLETQQWAIQIMHKIDIDHEGDVSMKEWESYWRSVAAGEDDAAAESKLQRIKAKLTEASPGTFTAAATERRKQIEQEVTEMLQDSDSDNEDGTVPPGSPGVDM